MRVRARWELGRAGECFFEIRSASSENHTRGGGSLRDGSQGAAKQPQGAAKQRVGAGSRLVLHEFGSSGDDFWFCRVVLINTRAAVAARPDES